MTRRLKDIPYTVIRSRRRTADIVVERNGEVIVRAPIGLCDQRLERAIADRELWIHRARAEWEELNSRRVRREFLSGESFLYLGRTYRLKVVSDPDAQVSLRNGRLLISQHLLKRTQSARKALRDFYISRGEEILPARVQHLAKKVGVQPGRVRVKELGYHWASCGARGDLNFHWKTLMAPRTVLDYVIVHELCHLRHRDHSTAFWNEIDKVLPSYRERKQWLRANGASLDV